MLNTRLKSILAISGIVVLANSAVAAAPHSDTAKKDKVYEKISSEIGGANGPKEEKTVKQEKKEELI